MPIALFFGLVLLQLVPLPPRVVSLISPHTVALRDELLGPGSGDAATLSLYPHATRHDLRLLMAVTAVFIAVVNVFRTARQIQRLLTSVALIGSAVALLALAQDLTRATNVYWVGPPGKTFATAGPFIHYGHYGQYANFTIGAILALLAVRIGDNGGRRGAGNRSGGGATRFSVATGFLLGIAGLVAAATVLLSGSRAAAASTVAAGVFAAVCFARARGMGGRGWVAMPILALVVGVGLAFGSEAALDRLGTLRSAQSYADRVQILKDLTAVWAKFPSFGTGLGTHETVYPMFERSMTRTDLFTHAENEYAQLLEETGYPGLGLALAFLATVGAATLRAARRAKPAIRLAAVGLSFGVVAALVHSLADFGQHIPATALLMAVFCGLLVSLGKFATGGRTEPARDARAAARTGESLGAAETVGLPSWGRRHVVGLRFVTALLVVAASVWAGTGSVRAAGAAAYAERVTALGTALEEMRVGHEGEAANDEYAHLIDLASQACALEPGSVKHRYQLALSRWQSISRVRDLETGGIILGPTGVDAIARIVADLRDARRLCPTFGPLYRLAGQLRTTVLADPHGETDIGAAYALSRCDPLALSLAAELDVRAGRWDEAEAKYRRSLLLGEGPFRGSYEEVARVCLQHRQYDMAERLAGDDYDRISLLAGRLQHVEQEQPRAARLAGRAFERLAALAAASDAPAELLVRYARECATRGRPDLAIDAYRRAVSLDYGNLELQLTLARALHAAGRTDEARRAARASLTIDPSFDAAKQFLQEVHSGGGSARPAGSGTQPAAATLR